MHVAFEIGDLRVHTELAPHPLLGRAHLIELRDGGALTAMSELDWDRPARIPTIAEPGTLPPGAGALLLNAIAVRARDAGVAALRYAGPYPTPALFRALARSFRTRATEDEFTRDLIARAARVATDEIAIDFEPAPHARVDFAGGWSEVRDAAIDRVVVGGVACERGGSPGRLDGDGSAELWFGDAIYARLARVGARGELLDGPHAIPALDSSVIGAAFPPALRAALAELVADAVPAPLADDARAIVAASAIAWADLGARAARRVPDGSFAVHAILWERIAPLGLARLALAITEALAPVVTSALIAELTTY